MADDENLLAVETVTEVIDDGESVGLRLRDVPGAALQITVV
jgi:hypothetical protein